MNTIKFTTDGRKVAIVGKLNSQETIVQEIFIVGDAEIPSGENFVVKSLHDTPVISWKDKTLKELDERFNKEQKKWEDKISEQEKLFRKVSSDLDERYRWSAIALKGINPEVFELLSKFLSGKIHFVVSSDYSGPEVKVFNDVIGGQYDYPYHSFDRDLKLMTFFGKKDYAFNIGINRYSDGSGSYSTHVPFETEKQALQYVQDYINEGDLTTYKINAAERYKLTIDKEKLAVYKTLSIDNIKKSIETTMKSIDQYNDQIKNINQLG